ncbi:MAG: (2Fe-2S)-binding protein [Chloroflexales bacterium]|nr:(2Fe-2S)-binding protein [Chloroflexales bacterium]
MPSITVTINGQRQTIEAPPDMPLLWLLRDLVGLSGTKYGCGVGVCGACVVHLDDEPVRACLTPVALVDGRRVTTIEGLSAEHSHPLQQAWLAEDVPQCGYCQSGQIMSAAALLAKNPHPGESEIIAAMENNFCRCGTYQRISRAIRRAAEEAGK